MAKVKRWQKKIAITANVWRQGVITIFGDLSTTYKFFNKLKRLWLVYLLLKDILDD